MQFWIILNYDFEKFNLVNMNKSSSWIRTHDRSVTLRTIPALRPIKDKTFLKIVLVRLTYHGTKDFTECRLMWVIDAVNSCFIWETSTQTRETIHMDVYLPHRKHFSFAIKSWKTLILLRYVVNSSMWWKARDTSSLSERDYTASSMK